MPVSIAETRIDEATDAVQTAIEKLSETVVSRPSGYEDLSPERIAVLYEQLNDLIVVHRQLTAP